MAEVAKGIIDIEINTGNAAAQLKALQQQINAFTTSINKNDKFATQSVAKYNSELKDFINSSRFFTAETVKMQTAAGALDSTLKKGRGSLSQFFSARFNKQSALYAETLALASERAKSLQTQFIATSGAGKGMQEALAIRPISAFNSELTIAAQKSQILTSMFKQGTTQLINFGKNVQWAGRQLMVGFTLPLTVFGTTAGKTFMELERQAVNFRKVYGDIFTPPGELEDNLRAVTQLAEEYTKYGIAVKDTIGLAAEAAAAGRTNQELIDATTQATRLATLGQMNQAEALETTIALQSAFRLSGEELANTINFLNMVENQTVVTLQDLSAAIPRVAPVIKGLGGDVQDMAVFLAAMQEGGVSAEQGANALKSGLASLINPTKQAKEMLADFNINLDAIIQTNRGDLMGTVQDFARALQTLDEFQRQQALEQVFGKFQYARLGALFENIVRDGSQANQVLQTTQFSVQELAQSAEKELSAIEQSLGVQLTGAMERFKLAIAPIGQLFVELAIPVINFLTRIVEAFNDLPDFQKKFIAFATIIGGLVIPAGTMFVGLLLNLGGQILKLAQYFGVFTKGLLTKGGVVGGIKAVTQSMKYMSLEEIDSAIAARQLGSATETVNQAFRNQVAASEGARVAVNELAGTYNFLIARMREAASLSTVTLGTPGAAMKIAQNKGRPVKKFARGGVVPGSGNSDTVPAMLMPGEFVVKKSAVQSIGTDFLQRLNTNSVPGFKKGTSNNPRDPRERLRAKQEEQLGLPNKPANKPQTQTVKFDNKEKLELTHFDSGLKQKFVTPSFSLDDGQQQVFSKLGSVATQQEGFTAYLPRSINQDLKNSRGGVFPSRLIDIIKKSKSNEMFAPINTASKSLGGGPIGENVKRSLIQKLSEWEKNNPGSLIKDKDLGPMYRSIIKTQNPRLHNLLNTPMQWRVPTEKVYERMGISNPKDLQTGLVRDNLAKDGFVVFNKGIPLDKSLDKTTKKAMQRNLKPGQVAVYVNKSGKLSFLGSSGNAVSTTYTGGVQLPASLKKFRKQFVTKNDGGPIMGSSPALLTPGEFVVNSEAAAANRPFLDALNSGRAKRFLFGTKRKSNSSEMAAAIAQMKGEDPTLTTPQARSIVTQNMRTESFNRNISRVGSAAGVAAFPALIAGPMLQQSSNQTAQKFGEIINAATPVLFGLQILAPALKAAATRFPLLLGPWGALLAGVVTLGGLIIKTGLEIDKMKGAGAELTNAMMGSADQVKRFGEAFGTQSVTERRISQATQAAVGPISAESQQVASQFMESDAGKQLLEDMKKVRKEGQDATVALRNQLNRAILAGVITPDDAKSIAIEVGSALNDQNLSVQVAAQIVQLTDENGNIITENVMKINAQLTPVLDEDTLRRSAEATYESQATGFQRLRDRLFGGGGREQDIQDIQRQKISQEVTNSINATALSVENLRLAQQQGDISLIEYRENIRKLGTDAKSTVATGLDLLGVKIEDIQQVAGKGSIFDLNENTRFLTEAEKEAVKMLKNLRNEASGLFDAAFGENAGEVITNYIIENITGGDAVAAGEIFAQLMTGTLDIETQRKIIAGLSETYPTMAAFFSNAMGEAVKTWGNWFSPGSGDKGATLPTPTDDNNEFPPPPGGGTKSAIQTLEERIKATKDQLKATQYLIRNGITPEALANLDAAAAIEIMTKKRKGLIKAINEQAVMQRVITKLMMSGPEKQIQLLDAQNSLIGVQISEIQRQIDIVERLNQLDQRQVEVRQRGLDAISKKEEKINKDYDARIEALDRVAQANQRVAQSEQDRISLASALSSGDIAGAALAANQMTQNFAQTQIEDTRAQLEQQRQRELEAITVSINGQMLTRSQIEAQIDQINERIYNRNLSTIPLQDQIYNLEQDRLANEREIERINAEILLDQIEQELNMVKQNKQLKGMVGHYKSMYRLQQAISRRDFGRSAEEVAQNKAFGGQIKRMAFGGLLKYTSNEAPPAMAMGGSVKKYAFGSIVPGLGNTDRVPALLTPGEFVVRKSVAEQNMPLLKALNGDVFPKISSNDLDGSATFAPVSTSNITNMPVYNNYSVNVNVPNVNASPEEIANTVISRLRRTASGDIRGTRRI